MANVLIVGASSAIASEVARLYARRGDRLYLIARDAAKLARLGEELAGSVVGEASADLMETPRNEARIDAAFDVLGRIDIAVLAHGVLSDQAATEREHAAAERSIHVNFQTMVSLLIPLANRMEARGAGRIAVLSSVAGERGRPRNYTYGAAKGALSLYLQGLRSRLWKSGVGIYTIKLGPVDTPMTAGHPRNALFASAPDVARSLVRGLEGRDGVHYVPWYWAPIMGVVRWLPEPIFQRFAVLSGR